MIKLRCTGVYKDGGSKSYRDKDNNEYWQDFSIKSKRDGLEGRLYKGNKNDKNSKLAKGEFILEERIITKGSVLISKIIKQ